MEVSFKAGFLEGVDPFISDNYGLFDRSRECESPPPVVFNWFVAWVLFAFANFYNRVREVE
jgi:hypothetical protein